MFDRWPAAGKCVEGGRRARGVQRVAPAVEPLVSIVTVAWNPGIPAIRRTLRSVQAQSYAAIEHIVIDGGSTDGTLAWLRENDDSIDYWISEPDQGIYDAMNKGLMLAKGSIIGLLNCGDEYTEHCCRIVAGQIAQARSTQPVILAGAMRRTDETRGLAFSLKSTPQRLRSRIDRGMPLNHPATFVTAQTYRSVGLFDPSYRLSGDYEFIYRAVRCPAVEFQFVDETLAVMPMGGISERVTSLWRRGREHYRIREGFMSAPRNAFNCARMLALHGAKLIMKSRLSAGAMRFYYHIRHPR
jgi:glycosyltransferase involved in cell wall biosynthesis